MSETPPATPPSRIARLVLGILLGNAVAALQFVGVIIVARQYSVGRPYLAYGTPSLFFVAMTAGFVASTIWRPLRLTMGQSALHSFSSTVFAMGGATLAMHEGIICILMATPVYYLLFAAGAEIGRRWLKHDNNLRLTIVPLLFLFGAVEFLTRPAHSGTVVDELIIAASH